MFIAVFVVLFMFPILSSFAAFDPMFAGCGQFLLATGHCFFFYLTTTVHSL